MCVRNTQVEDIHAGIVPAIRTGDYSNVTVVDADRRRIPWNDVSHFDDHIMRDLMRQRVGPRIRMRSRARRDIRTGASRTPTPVAGGDRNTLWPCACGRTHLPHLFCPLPSMRA